MKSGPINAGSVPRARSRAVLTHAGGLHARPAIKLTQLAKRFESAVWVALAEHGPWTDRDVQIAGPPSMVQTTKFRLLKAGVPGENIQHDPIF